MNFRNKTKFGFQNLILILFLICPLVGNSQKIFRTTEYYKGAAFRFSEYDTQGRTILEVNRRVELPVKTKNEINLVSYQRNGSYMDQTWLTIKGFLDSEGFIKFENSPISLLFIKNDSILKRDYFEEFRYAIPEDSVKMNLNNVWSITSFPLLSHRINEVMCIDTLFKEPFREAYRYYSDNYEYTYDRQDNAAGITISTYSYPDARTEIFKTITKMTFSRQISETREFLIRPEIEVKDTYKDFENRVIKEIFYLPISGKFKEKRLKPRLTITYEYQGIKVVKKKFLANKEKYEVTVLNTFYPMD